MENENTPIDAEISAMAAIVQALTPLEEEARERILCWANQRFKDTTAHAVVSRAPGREPCADEKAGESMRYEQIHDVFDAANPTTGPDRVLVAGYWFQVYEHHDDLEGMTLNRALKDLGHVSANITRDLDSLINRTPHLVQQIKKEGSTRQARKKYRLTREGIRAVEKMLNREGLS